MQYILDFVDDTSQEDIDAYLTAHGATVVRTFNAFEKVFVCTGAELPPKTEIIEDVVPDDTAPLQLLSYEPDPSTGFPMVTFNTEGESDWWKVSVMRGLDFEAETQTIRRRGDLANVYVVDSGILKTHPEFVDADVSDLYSFTGDFTDNKGHGTAIASLISGKTCGITSASIKNVKIFEEGVDTLQSHLLAAFDAIITDVEANPTKLPIVNLSWIIAKNEFVEDKIRILLQRGAFVVGAAGNGAGPIENVTPASMPEICTVGAYSPEMVPCTFSNYTGPDGALDVWAPGEQLAVAQLDGTIGFSSGTSLATAIQSAAGAYNSFFYKVQDQTFAVTPEVYNVPAHAKNKAGLLTLDGVYTNSVNFTTQMETARNGENITFARPADFKMWAVRGEKTLKFVFAESLCESYSFIDPLPEGLTCDNGMILGEVTAPVGLYTGNYTMKPWNEDSKTFQFSIAVVDQGTSADTEGLDPAIKIILQAGCAKVPNCTSCGGGESCFICAEKGPYCDCSATGASVMLMKFLIDFKDDASADDISNYLNSNALTIEKVYDSFLKTYLVQGDTPPPLSELVERVVADSSAPIKLVTDSVVSIKLTSDETDNIVFATDDDSSWWKLAVQIKPDLTGADQVVQRRGETATVYIVDSGIKKELEEFEGVDITDLYSFTGDFTDNKGHGTAIASVIAGRTCGLTNSKLKSVKIFEEGVDTLQSHLLAAFDAIITDVEANPNTFPVVNLSWVIDVNEFIEDKIQALINNGIFVIVAAGNGGGPITNLTPARMSQVCTVGAYGPSLSPSPFSNYTESWESPALDVFAPGENIKVVGLDGSYSTAQGTSVACAIQTAAAAYNSFLAVLADGTPVEAPSTSSFLTANCFTFSSLMQLEPPFNFCTKQITRFTTQLMGENGARYPRLGVLNLRATIGENVKLLAFYPAAYKEVEAVLPPGLELSNGWIHGVPETTEPAGYTGQMTFTLWDNTTTTIDYNIAVVPETVPATDDPVINLVLSLPADCVATGPGEPSCWGSCSLTGQSPPCSYCDGGGKSGSSTICRCEGSNICP